MHPAIALRPMTEADLELKVKWANDDVINEYVGFSEKVTLEGTKKWFAAQMAEPRITLLSVTLDDRMIGFAKVIQDVEGNSAEYNGLVLDTEYWGKGLGKYASQIVMRRAYEVQGFERLWAYFFPWNVRSIEMHKKLGFHYVREADFTKYHPGHQKEYTVPIYEVWHAEFEAAVRANQPNSATS